MTSEQLSELLHTEHASPVHKQQKEASLQSQCVKYFKAQYPLLSQCMTHMKNEEPDARRRKLGAAMGVVPGYPDLMLFVPAKYDICTEDGNKTNIRYNALAIELKNDKTGRQSEAQKQCQKRLEICGYGYVIIRTIDDFVMVVNDYVKHIDANVLEALATLHQHEECKATASARQEFKKWLKYERI